MIETEKWEALPLPKNSRMDDLLNFIRNSPIKCNLSSLNNKNNIYKNLESIKISDIEGRGNTLPKIGII